jgi:GAF domain-containing protein
VTQDLGGLADELRSIFSVSAGTISIVAPVNHARLLEMIVRTAAHVIKARTGSLLLVDEAAQELVFEVATVEDLSRLKNLRVPLGEGIAGLVAMTGQPMAIADVQSDPRHAHDIARQTGYLPRSLLCVPLQYEDRVIGVLELLDKEGADGFDASDMHALALFAGQAAVAIEQSRAQQSLAALVQELLGSIGQGGGDTAAVLERVSSFAEDLQSDAAFQRALQISQVVHEIAQSGEEATAACLTMLRGFAEYLRAHRGRP